MNATRARSRTKRIVLVTLLVVALVVLGLAVAVLLPILTHQSTGGSGQQVPDRIVSETSAVGSDGRTRELSVMTVEGKPADLAALTPGEVLVVDGKGFNADIGIYVAICGIPASPDEKPSPCLGGVPSGATEGAAAGATALSSVWITDDWAWRAFATQGYDNPKQGSFSARITVPDPVEGTLDCRVSQCAIATRADHTASSDRVQDILLPVKFK
ncbi:hypothetical protein G7068_06515 [Leucobacter viscericola]|uniref:Uncharacterized protein n=1 Tax=Leucobacter viscericola TaxID=2714935 RepID=A0A6G7XET8_9MICO|nr:hypothetical protein [Leucobacter viscericola]QIK62888.1 hypothetical protein G7068_06515 [Leucobacter viscericola]